MPANNLKRKDACFHRELANVGKIRDNFLIIPLRNDLPVKVKEEKSLNGFKAGLDEQEVFFTIA